LFRPFYQNLGFLSFSAFSCYFGLFWVISGSIRVSIGGFVKRVISGYSRESCYLGHFKSFLVIFGHLWSFMVISGHFWSFLVILAYLFPEKKKAV